MNHIMAVKDAPMRFAKIPTLMYISILNFTNLNVLFIIHTKYPDSVFIDFYPLIIVGIIIVCRVNGKHPGLVQ